MLKRNGAKQAKIHEKKGSPATSKSRGAEASLDKESVKVTLYVRPDQIIGIETIQLQERKRTGIRPDKSKLVQEALDLLISKYKPHH
jgi:hypothetical protein